ncbi:hypothetical protein [Aquabacterium sp. OR-4]|uniref:hypothetical protein n=1 Tax=Aquabacterium sp. OR-4 TaxID=2978127 RepID=UPI0021B329D1|nr:hypothetical protein [Aquabacterium sp. OR-4]MDT7835643.1 hypothetical protein [Aquabacterium sp. OR-4]
MAPGPGAALREVDDRIAGFCDKYSPQIAAQMREARARLHALFPRGYELVYDNHNALVLGIGPTPRSADAVISVVGYPRWVTLFFLHAGGLSAPPGLLEPAGEGQLGLRLRGAADLARPDVLALLQQAVAPQAAAFRSAPPLVTLIKAQATDQRSRRPRPLAFSPTGATGPAALPDAALPHPHA